MSGVYKSQYPVECGNPLMSKIEIRSESIAAARALIAALDAELLALYPEDGTDQHFHLDADEVSDGQGAFLVAYVAGEAAGCGAFRMLDATTAEIKRMYVRPAMRGMGTGRVLLESLEERARELGAGKLVLESGPRQPAAIGLYAAAGYMCIDPYGSHVEHPLSTFLGKDL